MLDNDKLDNILRQKLWMYECHVFFIFANFFIVKISTVLIRQVEISPTKIGSTNNYCHAESDFKVSSILKERRHQKIADAYRLNSS